MASKKNVESDVPEITDVAVENEKPALSHPSYEELATQLTTMETKANENWEKLLRVQAELENMRKRNERDLTQAHKFALESFGRELLAVVDSLERSLEQTVVNDIATFRTGVELTLKLFQSTLDKFAIKVIDPLGGAFDPTLHEAMSMQESNDAPPGTVMAVLQKGYQLHDRLLRPALVVVAKAPEKKM